MAKQGKIYFVDVEFTDEQVEELFAFPCMFFLRDHNGLVVKQITYDKNGTKSIISYAAVDASNIDNYVQQWREKLLQENENPTVEETQLGFKIRENDNWRVINNTLENFISLGDDPSGSFYLTANADIKGFITKLEKHLWKGREFIFYNATSANIILKKSTFTDSANIRHFTFSEDFVLKSKSWVLLKERNHELIQINLGSSSTPIEFATQPEMESQTPPDTENNKAVSLFGLWKWVKKLNYLYLNITTANSVLNKIWYDGLNAWITNKDGVNKQLAYDENGVNIPQGRITTTTGITTETKTNSNLYQNGKNVIIDNGANNINLRVNAFAGGNFCATYIKDGTGTITIIAGSGVTLDLVQYTDVVNGKSGSRFMISQNGSTNTFKIFVRNYE